MNEQTVVARPVFFRFPLNKLIFASITIASLIGLVATQYQYQSLQAKFQAKQELCEAASIAAASAFDFRNMVGQPINNYPLIQVLGNREEYPADSILNYARKLRPSFFHAFPDGFGNSEENLNKINRNRNLESYRIVLKDGKGIEAKATHKVFVYVQDGVVWFVFEHRFSAAT